MRLDELRALFQANYGAPPEVIASAPGRVNIIGEHTDYNGGEVLPIAIDRRTLVAVRKSGDAGKSRASSTTESRSGEFDARAPRRGGGWWDYVSGVCAKLRADNVDVPQFDAVVASDVPRAPASARRPRSKSRHRWRSPHLRAGPIAQRSPSRSWRSSPGERKPSSSGSTVA